MNVKKSLTKIMLLWMCIAVLLLGGCSMFKSSTREKGERSRPLDGAAAGERVSLTELDGLTHAFADRYVGLLYSVCDALQENNPDPAQRQAAQVLLVDVASNVYDIASNPDAFTRVLDLVVVTTLVSEVWGDDGRAVAVFGERGQALADALSHARAESRLLAVRVLTADQLDTLDALMRDWLSENPQVVRTSFVRFSNFAFGRNRTATEKILQARGVFADVAEAGQAVDEVRLLSERIFYRFKRESTLRRWQTAAMKADLVATPEINRALADVHSLTEEVRRLPANIAAEREAILTGIDDRLQRADATMANVRATVNEANTFVESLKPASESLNETLGTADTLLARYTDLYRLKMSRGGRPFDVREYEQTAKDMTLAAERMTEVLTTMERLLGSSDLRGGIQEVNDSVDGRIMTVADQSQVVMNAFFWRVLALLVVLFACSSFTE